MEEKDFREGREMSLAEVEKLPGELLLVHVVTLAIGLITDSRAIVILQDAQPRTDEVVELPIVGGGEKNPDRCEDHDDAQWDEEIECFHVFRSAPSRGLFVKLRRDRLARS